MKLLFSPTTQHIAFGRAFYMKRDDLLHPQFSGNKARKLMHLLTNKPKNIETLIGYGSAQANSLYSLAALAELNGWRFEFYVDHIASFIKQSPRGNYAGALALGAKIVEISQQTEYEHLTCLEYIQDVRKPEKTSLLIPEGGRSCDAQYGVTLLAKEILSWINENKIKNPVIALPSGTGTTALYLHKYLSSYDIEVLTCACVGGNAYLIHQFKELGESEFPTILETEKKHHFGKLYREDFEIWQQLKQETDVEFDLLYDPYMWQCLKEWLPHHPDKNLIYVHQGGILGNQSMLPRYNRKFKKTNH